MKLTTLKKKLKKAKNLAKKREQLFEKRVWIVVAIAIPVVVGLMIWGWLRLHEKTVVNYLPASETSFYVEWKSLHPPRGLHQTEWSLNDRLMDWWNTSIGIPYSVFEPYVAGPQAVARLQLGEPETVFLMRTKRHGALINALQSAGVPNETLMTSASSPTLYSFSQSYPVHFMFLDHYLALSSSQVALEALQATYHDPTLSLKADEDHVQLFERLPKYVWAKGYLNFHQLNVDLPAPYSQMARPLQQLLNRFGFTLRKQGGDVHFNTLLLNRPDALALMADSMDFSPLTYELTQWIPASEQVAYFGGANLAGEWQNTLTTLSKVNPAYGLILEGLFRAQVSRIFGGDVDVRTDLYPLFESEYGLVLEHRNDQPLGIKLLLAHSDRAFVTAKMEKLKQGFETLAAQFTPELKVIDLPDDQQNREVVADPARLAQVMEDFEGQSIECLEVKESVYGFCYTITDNVVIMANHLDGVRSSLLAAQNPDQSLDGSRSFRHMISQLSSVSDELTYMNLDHLNQRLNQSSFAPLVADWLKGLGDIAWVKHYFEDGVSTEGFLTFQ